MEYQDNNFKDVNNVYELGRLFGLTDYEMTKVASHEGGRNLIYVCQRQGEAEYVLRISALEDREERDYLAETDFVHYLAQGGAAVADVLTSISGRLVEKVLWNGKEAFVSLFRYAKGMLISDNGYRYRDGAPMSEYFYNTGKTLGKIHSLSKSYQPNILRQDYFEKYNMEYIDTLIPDKYMDLKQAISERLSLFEQLPQAPEDYGLVHFDFSDGNYHIDMNTGEITVFDFDNCMNCWYMFDLANLWTHGVGWIQFEEDKEKRRDYMKTYFDTILEGYQSETSISEELLNKLPLFIDMVLIENIVDEFECCARDGEDVDFEDIEDAALSLLHRIPYAGFC